MQTADYKKITKESYQATAQEFARNVDDLVPTGSIEKFIKLLPPKAKIIDIGCGSGRDAKLFTNMDAIVLGIDFSSNLIDIAKRNAPLAEFQLMDIETMNLPAASFDGAWAACSLGHISKKIFPDVIKRIHFLLKEKGYFYLTLKKGANEILEQDFRYDGDIKKFCAFYEEEELKNILQEAQFKILEFDIIEKQHAYQTHDALRVFCQKI
ncbi:S-adenosyl-L-methionine-dependent methyltransferases (plasmid) [Legionella adelaidensis]|uniref:Methyltransferase n=1 Tax=Legionella adelaidensis TaxID=45056 RepID=A0A0W0R5N6_9GAMM|nr:class I SAM-dependent methyltransferase [Legionella adelaidensis]KTC66332.1 methyltransferase [Legionella adelaidensis]VEH84930.1 S-adenosyl-L-methionine-dependent methyltransferases [Legionella adelaidensis]